MGSVKKRISNFSNMYHQYLKIYYFCCHGVIILRKNCVNMYNVKAMMLTYELWRNNAYS